jgi:hypothetical protein
MAIRLILIIFSALMVGFAQTPEPLSSGRSPQDVVTLYWLMGTRGELLTKKGWDEASELLFTRPAPQSSNKIISIRANEWSLPWKNAKITSNTAELIIGYDDRGQIDSELRYIPPKPTHLVKTGMIYHLVYVRTYWTQRSFDQRGKMEERKMTGPMEWQIDGSPEQPWTTVNTAIRYVLEARGKIKDPVIKKNADQTITKLLELK